MSSAFLAPFASPFDVALTKRMTVVLPSESVGQNDRKWTVPASQYWRFLWAFAFFHTDATVLNRFPQLTYFPANSNNRFLTIDVPVPQTAGQDMNYLWAINANAFSNPGQSQSAPIPDWILSNGMSVHVFISGSLGALDVITSGLCQAGVEIYTATTAEPIEPPPLAVVL